MWPASRRHRRPRPGVTRLLFIIINNSRIAWRFYIKRRSVSYIDANEGNDFANRGRRIIESPMRNDRERCERIVSLFKIIIIILIILTYYNIYLLLLYLIIIITIKKAPSLFILVAS